MVLGSYTLDYSSLHRVLFYVATYVLPFLSGTILLVSMEFMEAISIH